MDNAGFLAISKLPNVPFNCCIENPRTDSSCSVFATLAQRLACKLSHKIPSLHLIVQYEAKASEVIRMSFSDEYAQLSFFPILI